MKLVFRKLFFCLLAVVVFTGVVFIKTDKVLAFSAGEAVSFNIDPSYDWAGRSSVNATLRYVGEKALFYVEDDWWNGLAGSYDLDSLVSGLAGEFDKIIYPRLTRVFGSEWSPGIDREYRITFLVFRMKEGTGGYFNSSDEYSKAQAPSSNEREMLYLNGIYLNSVRTKSFLAHEFQHLITFYQKDKLKNLAEDVWLNEARSEYAPTVCGYDDDYSGSNLERRVNEFLRNPSDSLTEWRNESEDYGPVSLFMQYFVSRYGEAILLKMMMSDAVGIASINAALSEAGFTDRFSDVFTNWTVANYVNDCKLGDGQKFCYLNSRLLFARFHLNPSNSNTLLVSYGVNFSFSDSVKDWAGHWYEILPQNQGLNLGIIFSGSDKGNFQVPILIYYNDGSKSVRYLKLNNQKGADIIWDFGYKAKSVIIIPSSQTKLTGFSSGDPAYPMSFSAIVTSAGQASSLLAEQPETNPAPSPAPAPAKPNYQDGSLIRAAGDYRVYVISGKYKRWIQSPAIFGVYPHFGWQNIIGVTPAERDWYQDAWLVRADGDYRVYEINGDLSKHWLNMSAEQFVKFGGAWDMVYVINKKERDLYKTGADVTK
ncbi:hypothetical protein KJ853_01160 [Patescibacteria group bacterium]|nr:hypothetical protein [Patescibacteria group bacterium]